MVQQQQLNLAIPVPAAQGERGVRTATASAATNAVLFTLSRKTFYRIAAHYPEMADTLSIIAAARAALNSNQSVNAAELLRIKASAAGSAGHCARRAVLALTMPQSLKHLACQHGCPANLKPCPAVPAAPACPCLPRRTRAAAC